MKVTVSYINSKFDLQTTLKKIDKCENVDYIHVDLMDGKFVPTKNFEKKDLLKIFKDIDHPLDVHLMTEEPESYLEVLFKLNLHIIYFHPSTTGDGLAFINLIRKFNRKVGIVINPNENCRDFKDYFPLVDAVLVMSVTPGKGGQHFLRESLVNYQLLRSESKNYIFEIFVDGGITDETISFVKDADGVVSGSFVCNSDDFEKQVNKLKEKGE